MKPRLSDQIYQYLRDAHKSIHEDKLIRDFGRTRQTIRKSISRLNDLPKVEISIVKTKCGNYYELKSRLKLRDAKPAPLVDLVYQAMYKSDRMTLKQIAAKVGDPKMDVSKILQALNGLSSREGVTIHRFKRWKQSEYLMETEDDEIEQDLSGAVIHKTPFNPTAINFIFSNRSSELFHKSL